MAAYLHKARFNAAAGEQRRGGRDLQGYVRCKLGRDTTEYMRGDTVAHVILEFSCGTAANTAASFSAGACVEAYTHGKLTEHFWIGDGIPAATVLIQSENKTPLQTRQFKDRMEALGAVAYESKKSYVRDFTGKLGVWKRYSDYNPYLEAFTRSVSFTPLVSVDRFVCDYILEDRPVEITTMKENLESYKEAERQAHGAVMRIDALKKITDKAADWRNYKSLILKQEYLKLCIELNIKKAEQERETQKLENAEQKVIFFELEISKTEKQKLDWEGTRAETMAALAANDAHNLYRRACECIERIKTELAEHQKQKYKYETSKAQCEAMLGRPLEDDPEKNTAAIEAAEQEARKEKEVAANEKNFAAAELLEVQTELTDLEKGIFRFPDEPTALCEALRNAGIDAHFLADTAEITDMAWADAIEGWLNTRRFALLVEPSLFQKALEVYNSLPRKVAGAFLPNLEKMRGASPQKNTLAALVQTESPYSRIYIDYVLGDVVCADIAALKQFKMAVTKECMTYGNHTANRIREEVYKRRYLGQAARQERRAFLAAEQARLKNVLEEAASREEKAAQREEIYHRVAKTLIELKYLFPALELCDKLNADLIEAETERNAIDTQSFRDLEEKVQHLNADIKKAEESITKYNVEFGKVSQIVESSRAALTSLTAALGEKETDIQTFAETHEDVIVSCENYADEKLKAAALTDLQASYESTLKGFISRAENLRKEYQNLVQVYDREFNALLSLEPETSDEAG
ncbi:hypothetical protein AGMMS50212_02380 [Spirochaetia bacterium]|nr:hypothetical protein AGMMS50212_02380 [Spirochaetia bacterium]